MVEKIIYTYIQNQYDINSRHYIIFNWKINVNCIFLLQKILIIKYYIFNKMAHAVLTVKYRKKSKIFQSENTSHMIFL